MPNPHLLGFGFGVSRELIHYGLAVIGMSHLLELFSSFLRLPTHLAVLLPSV